ncbi:unnamed protein product [Rodentolepis nana]|uniref:RNase H domain-containing protein n=1 Tax=Rodentolepis nana TaxID=102285 RepID=A0A0R3TIR8_RODNA|nr:unnamed protein product [Rodentolepis nana]
MPRRLQEIKHPSRANALRLQEIKHSSRANALPLDNQCQLSCRSMAPVMLTILQINGSKSSPDAANLLALETINVNYTGDGSTILQINGSKSSLRVIYKSALLRPWKAKETLVQVSILNSSHQWPLVITDGSYIENQANVGAGVVIHRKSSKHWCRCLESQANVSAGVYSELFSFTQQRDIIDPFFSFYAAAGHNRSAEGEIEAIRIALCQ